MRPASCRGSVVVTAICVMLALLGCSCGRSDPDLTVFAASSLSGHLETAMDSHTAMGSAASGSEGGVIVEYQFAGSQALLEQIRQGAQPDIVILAEPSIDAPRYIPEPAGNAGLQPRVLVRNQLALVTPPDNPGDVQSLDDLARPELRIAICAPTVPCGASTATMASQLHIDVAPDTTESSVRSVLAKVIAQEVDAAVVYATDAQFAGDQVKLIDTVSTASGYAAWQLNDENSMVDAWFAQLITHGVDGLVALGFPAFP